MAPLHSSLSEITLAQLKYCLPALLSERELIDTIISLGAAVGDGTSFDVW